jgi:c-di-GMP-binding flagellar brake protein YcgR
VVTSLTGCVICMLKIGTVIMLELKYGDKLDKFKCKVVEQKENQIYIDYPINMETGRTVFLIDGTQLKGSFVSQDNNSVFLFESEVLGRTKQKIPMLILSYPGDDHLVKIQRRQYVRVETAVDVAVHPTNSEFKPFTTVTDDISAGGTAILLNQKHEIMAGQTIQLWVVLPMQSGEIHYLKVKSKVVRLIPLDDIRLKASLQFIDLSPQDRQLLLRFSFDRQLLMKKKGLES